MKYIDIVFCRVGKHEMEIAHGSNAFLYAFSKAKHWKLVCYLWNALILSTVLSIFSLSVPFWFYSTNIARALFWNMEQNAAQQRNVLPPILLLLTNNTYYI